MYSSLREKIEKMFESKDRSVTFPERIERAEQFRIQRSLLFLARLSPPLPWRHLVPSPCRPVSTASGALVFFSSVSFHSSLLLFARRLRLGGYCGESNLPRERKIERKLSVFFPFFLWSTLPRPYSPLPLAKKTCLERNGTRRYFRERRLPLSVGARRRTIFRSLRDFASCGSSVRMVY